MLTEELQDIKNRVAQKDPARAVTPAEFAKLLAADKETFLAFLIANNPGSMNDILRNRLGYNFELPYMPDATKLGRVAQIILDRGNKEELKTIIDNFQIKKDAISPVLWPEIDNVFNTK